jgi:hypothetical protein
MEIKTNPNASLPSTAAPCVKSLHKNKFALKQKVLMLTLFALLGYTSFGQLTVVMNDYDNALSNNFNICHLTQVQISP